MKMIPTTERSQRLVTLRNSISAQQSADATATEYPEIRWCRVRAEPFALWLWPSAPEEPAQRR